MISMLHLLFYLFCVFVLLLIFCKWYFGTTTWCKSEKKLYGKTVLITGGNVGIGKATAFDLARRGAKIIIASRNKERAEEAIQEIKDKTGNGNVRFMHLDLIDLDCVRQFADQFLKEETRLDILINNSGVVEWSYRSLGPKTKQNFDLVFGINHLGHFLLTYLLLDLLKKTGNSRIINVSSLRHLWRRTPLKFDKGPNKEGKFFPDLAGYNTSKLANVMHTKMLSQILKDTTVTANSMHPGMVRTNILVETFKEGLPSYIYFFIDLFFRLCSLEPVAGAQTVIYLAVEESLSNVSGQYFSHCSKGTENKLVQDNNACQQLWDFSLKMCNLK